MWSVRRKALREMNVSGILAVLIVDDDTIYQTVTGAMVKKMGYPVLNAFNGAEALAVFNEHEASIGCILLDIHMPHMNGIEFLRHLRSQQKNVEVIIVTGYLNEAKREQLAPLSPREYLKKPVDPDVLQTKLQECMEVAGASSVHENR